MTDVDSIVAGLSEAQRRALLAIGSDWTFTGKKTIHPSAANSLRLYHNDLVDHNWIKPTTRHLYPKGAYRLTPLGLAVRAKLEADNG